MPIPQNRLRKINHILTSHTSSLIDIGIFVIDRFFLGGAYNIYIDPYRILKKLIKTIHKFS